jgi:hypothetical protein
MILMMMNKGNNESLLLTEYFLLGMGLLVKPELHCIPEFG